jgi:hypothetical protein
MGRGALSSIAIVHEAELRFLIGDPAHILDILCASTVYV